jgi:hypothetical protein
MATQVTECSAQLFASASAANGHKVKDVLLTRASDHMHRQLAVHTRDDAHAYLHMLHAHDSIRSHATTATMSQSSHAGRSRGILIHAEAGVSAVVSDCVRCMYTSQRLRLSHLQFDISR